MEHITLQNKRYFKLSMLALEVGVMSSRAKDIKLDDYLHVIWSSYPLSFHKLLVQLIHTQQLIRNYF